MEQSKQQEQRPNLLDQRSVLQAGQTTRTGLDQREPDIFNNMITLPLYAGPVSQMEA